MSKKKNRKSAIADKPENRHAVLSVPPLQPADKRTKSRMGFVLPLILLAGIAAGFAAWRSQHTHIEPTFSLQGPLSARNACRRPPTFFNGQGFGRGVSLSTSERDLIGIAAVEFDPSTKKRSRFWQHASWSKFGQLSAFTLDRQGDVYVIPAPRVNLADNPPALQNRLYRIDASSGEMQLALEFPVAAAASARNPYAGMALSYDCDSHSLWLSSVAGSEPNRERGKILRIQLEPIVAVKDQLDDFDGFGIAPFSAGSSLQAGAHKAGQQGLLIASARHGSVLLQAMNKDGRMQGRPLPLLSIAGLGPVGNDRVRKIDIGSQGELLLHGTPFNFNLAQPSAQHAAVKYRFAWDRDKAAYRFVDWVQ
jgi:hypothetical protein